MVFNWLHFSFACLVSILKVFVYLKQKLKAQKMKTFKNNYFTVRDYECTNVVFCQADAAPSEHWIECTEADLTSTTCTQLWIEGNVKYFGWL